MPHCLIKFYIFVFQCDKPSPQAPPEVIALEREAELVEKDKVIALRSNELEDQLCQVGSLTQLFYLILSRN